MVAMQMMKRAAWCLTWAALSVAADNTKLSKPAQQWLQFVLFSSYVSVTRFE
jgi:hypothetical protein